MEKFPLSPENESNIQGEGFVIKKRQEVMPEGMKIKVQGKEVYRIPPKRTEAAGPMHPLEMRPGESTDAAKAREAQKAERERIASLFDDTFVNGEYSETLIVNPDGRIDRKRRANDANVPLLGEYIENTNDLYRVMKEVQDAHPEYKISFENDPNGKWVKYRINKQG